MLTGILISIVALVFIVILAHNAWIKNCINDVGPYGTSSGLMFYRKWGIWHIKYAWEEPPGEPTISIPNKKTKALSSRQFSNPTPSYQK